MPVMTIMSTVHPATKGAPFESIDLNLLVALDALLAEENVTEAARRCHVTQSAMSHSLAKLRALLGDELLVRTPAGMSPTPRARALAQPLARALAELRSVVASGSAFEPATARRVFTIGTSDYGSSVLIPALMQRLGKEAPLVELVVRPLPAAFASALEEERIDLALSPYPEPRATLVAQKLFDERFVCVLRGDHPVLRGAPRKLDLETFASLSHVQIAPRGARGGAVDDWLARAGKTRHVALRIVDFLVAPLVVAESDLVLTVPERIARVFARSHGLRVLEPPASPKGPGSVRPFPSFSMWQIWHQRRRQEPAHEWLRGMLSDVARPSARNVGRNVGRAAGR
jgi:DNA-binding transcriptional LysR family regulator